MNGRLDSLQAAVLLAKLTVFADELAARESVARYYDSRLGNAVVTPARVPDSTSSWAIYAILLRDGATRDHLQASLRADGVSTAIYYPRPLHLQPAYRHHHDGASLPVSEDLAERILALPIHPYLSEADKAHICDRVLDAVS
jgi:dTDP-4-amino-4,6-dideoxygalactose transaminase